MMFNGGFKKIVILVIILFPLAGQAGLIDEINLQIQEQESKRAELERQAQEYQQVINQKKGEIKTLNNQVAIFNAQIGKTEVEIRLTEDDISLTKTEIIQLEYGIEETGNDIEYQKENLGKIIQSIAEYDQTSQLEMMLQSEDFSDFFSQMTYLENLQNGVQGKVDKLRLLKEKLGQDKESKEDKKERLETLKSQLTDKKWSLDAQKKSKQAVLDYSRGEEQKYQQMLANIESQKKSLLGDLNRLRQLKAEELARLKELQEKPPSQYWASTNWYFNQDDPRWSKITVGVSSSEMGDYGCAVTSVSMIATYHGSYITPGQLAKQPIFYYDLIVWPRSWPVSPAGGGNISCTNCPPPHASPFDWFRLDRELGAGYPVIVFIRANGRGAGHYVVVHHKTDDGQYVVHDPLFGSNIYLDSTRVYISNLYETTTSIDQMIIYH